MSDARYELAERHAKDIMAKAEELSTAIYQAYRQAGYHAVVRIGNGQDLGDGRFIGTGDVPLQVDATVTFDIGKKVL